MGNIHVHHSRLTVGFILLALVVRMAVFFAVGASSAQALPTFNQAVGGIGPCDSCHTMSNTHPTATHHVGIACATCHNNGGTANPPLPTACGSCHGGNATILVQGHATISGLRHDAPVATAPRRRRRLRRRRPVRSPP